MPTSSTTTPATYSVSVQAYGTDGDPLGTAIPVTTTQSANSTYDLTWTPDLLSQLSNSITNSADYTAWTPASLTSSLAVPITDSNVCVKIYYALKSVTATYTYVDETSGQTLYTQTDTYDFNDPTNNAIFKADGIKPADATLSNETHLLSADDTSTAAQTDPTQLPYFGPTGSIFNNASYVLDSAKSDGITPLSYTYWPQSNISKTFYYTEATKPTISISAVDSLGNTIKTFDSGLTPTATLPSETATGATYLPTATAATIPGYTVTGFKAYASDSLSGAAPTELDGTFTPEQYTSFLASPANTLPYDTRALGDYQNLAIDFTYQGDPVTLMIQPVDSDGDPIGSPISASSGFVGESLTLNNPQIAGYLPASSTSTISIQPGQTTIPVTYSAVSTPTTTYGNNSKTADSTPTTSTTTTTTPTTGTSTSTSAATSTSPSQTTGQTSQSAPTVTTSGFSPEGSTSAKTVSPSEKALSSATISLKPMTAAKSVASPAQATSYSYPAAAKEQAKTGNAVTSTSSPTTASLSPTSLSYSPTSASAVKPTATTSQLSSSPCCHKQITSNW
ncbi:hypothetical protein [Companilactobacillus furfuricola]|uniref:hypothetical protein n=1 Tax=Companilactobacillus furfuricola TaxID=1462575 RepID=UPI000F787AA5|nr:hypothetical protein [Companilactobacillus furfuricola]